MREIRAYFNREDDQNQDDDLDEGTTTDEDIYGPYNWLEVTPPDEDRLPPEMRGAPTYCLIGTSAFNRIPGTYTDFDTRDLVAVWDGEELVVWGYNGVGYNRTLRYFMRFNTPHFLFIEDTDPEHPLLGNREEIPPPPV